jgi:hypothetical protein
VQLACDTPPFGDVSDDCAGDILEYLETAMTRAEALHIASHCSSPEAYTWVRSVVAEATAVIIHTHLHCSAYYRYQP